VGGAFLILSIRPSRCPSDFCWPSFFALAPSILHCSFAARRRRRQPLPFFFSPRVPSLRVSLGGRARVPLFRSPPGLCNNNNNNNNTHNGPGSSRTSASGLDDLGIARSFFFLNIFFAFSFLFFFFGCDLLPQFPGELATPPPPPSKKSSPHSRKEKKRGPASASPHPRPHRGTNGFKSLAFHRERSPLGIHVIRHPFGPRLVSLSHAHFCPIALPLAGRRARKEKKEEAPRTGNKAENCVRGSRPRVSSSWLSEWSEVLERPHRQTSTHSFFFFFSVFVFFSLFDSLYVSAGPAVPRAVVVAVVVSHSFALASRLAALSTLFLTIDALWPPLPGPLNPQKLTTTPTTKLPTTVRRRFRAPT
jgi:hypothetical protein